MNAEDDLKMSVFDFSMILGPRSVVLIINNVEENTVEDISWSFSATKDSEDGFNITYSDVIEELEADKSIVFTTKLESGFGITTVKATVNRSLTGEMTESINVVQLGPLSIGRPFALSFMNAS